MTGDRVAAAAGLPPSADCTSLAKTRASVAGEPTPPTSDIDGEDARKTEAGGVTGGGVGALAARRSDGVNNMPFLALEAETGVTGARSEGNATTGDTGSTKAARTGSEADEPDDARHLSAATSSGRWK